MYRDWPFFRTLLSNMDMVLAKSDIAIASRYARTGARTRSCARRSSPRLRGRVAGRRSTRLLAITGQRASCCDGNPLLERSIRNRFPYLDPLNHVQVELLQPPPRRRHATSASQRGIHLTINGIAAGLRNSG